MAQYVNVRNRSDLNHPRQLKTFTKGHGPTPVREGLTTGANDATSTHMAICDTEMRNSTAPNRPTRQTGAAK